MVGTSRPGRGDEPPAPPSAGAPAGRQRHVAALDGLRGVAALVVLVHHALHSDAAFYEPYRDPGGHGAGHLVWLMTYTPLNLLHNGTVAVFVFFVLSGYVLALPAAGGRQLPWIAYYPRRVVRLYLPVIVAVGLALLTRVVVPRHPVARASDWLLARGADLTWPDVVRDVVLWQPGATTSVLWSLQWEVVFSLALPLYLVAGRVLVRRFGVLPACAGFVLLSTVAPPGPARDWFVYLPIFGCGVVLALAGARLPRPRRLARVAGWALVATVALGLNATWTLTALTGGVSHLVARSGRAAEIAAATVLVLAAASAPAVQGVLARRPVLWLGSRSFSLYLVHEPIVVATATALGGRAPVIVTLALAVPVSLAVAEVFHRLVERPSMRTAARLGRWAAARTTREASGLPSSGLPASEGHPSSEPVGTTP